MVMYPEPPHLPEIEADLDPETDERVIKKRLCLFMDESGVEWSIPDGSPEPASVTDLSASFVPTGLRFHDYPSEMPAASAQHAEGLALHAALFAGVVIRIEDVEAFLQHLAEGIVGSVAALTKVSVPLPHEPLGSLNCT